VNKKYVVTLTDEERAGLEDLIRTGTGATRKLTHARILLKADVNAGGPGWPDQQISAALDVSTGTVQRIRQLFVEEGLQAALNPRPSQRPRLFKLDGAGEAHLIALACSQPPAGQARWTLRLLAEKMVELAYVDTLSHETVRQVLKKLNCSPGARTSGAFRRAPMASS
jgi:transposase